MYAWCQKCKAVVVGPEHRCSIHGIVEPLSEARCLEVFPLTNFEKELVNKHLGKEKLGEGVFLVYNDRYKRRRIIMLDKPLIEIRMIKDSFRINLMTKASGCINGMDIKAVVDANEERAEKMVEATKYFAEYMLQKFPNNNAVISFSGGKDSVVLSHLMRDIKIKNVFVDTTIEFPETYQFIKLLKDRGWDIDVVRAEKSFFSLCPLMGFPTSKNRWCCKTQKMEPFARYLRQFENEKVLVFEAIRRWESISRLGEAMERQHWYIKNQLTINPMLDWTALDAWIYIWKNNLPINPVYNYFDRGGCWLCPFGAVYRIILLKYTHPRFFSFLKTMGAIPRFRKFTVQRCSEGKPMKHIVFSDKQLAESFASLLKHGLVEVHESRIVCVPDDFSKRKIEELVNKASAKLFLGKLLKNVNNHKHLIEEEAF
jgi:phosphoadenosine phosphosulfate reductase